MSDMGKIYSKEVMDADMPAEYRTNLGTPETKMVKGQGVMETTNAGALRESNSGRGRFDLLPYEAIEALAKWYEAGAEKYDERNWEKGLSVKDCINRMVRHSLKAANGWTDEDHLAAVMWNAAAAITMMQRKPACNDHVWHGNETKEPIEPIDGREVCGAIQETQPGLPLSPGQIELILKAVLECNKRT